MDTILTKHNFTYYFNESDQSKMEGELKSIFGFSLSLLHVVLILLLGFPLFAFSQTKVTSLPGFNGTLPFDLETGYVGLGESEDVQLFYYFIKSERNPKDDPLLLWLTGGPSCSGFSALVYEIGPLRFNVLEYDRGLPTLVLNPYSWTKFASIIYIDSPVGTGFSYARSSTGSFASDSITRLQLYQFLRKWLLLYHPEFLSNPLYIGAESYTGMIISPVVLDILDGNEAGNVPFINFKGYMLGNAFTNLSRDNNERVPYAHRMGLISDELYESMKISCGGQYVNVDPSNTDCVKNLKTYYQCISRINVLHILERECDITSLKAKRMEKYRRTLGENFQESVDLKSSLPLEPRSSYPGCREYDHLLSIYWANDDRVQVALNITKGTVSKWLQCNYQKPYQFEIESTFPYLVRLSKRGYRSLVYSGDHDMGVPFSSTEAWIRDLNYPIIDDWRPWFVDGQVGGYTRTYSNKMTFATVKGAGHTPPEYKPKECFEMFKRWISNEPL